MSRSAFPNAGSLLVACVLVATHLASVVSAADCTSYAETFPYMQTSVDCIMRNMCYRRVFCCPRANEPDRDQCLDVTTFTCNLTAVCENHTSDAGWYPFTLNNGLSIACCRDGYTPTPVPSVPNFDYSESSTNLATTNSENSSSLDPEPVRTCDDETNDGCAATNRFPVLIRAFCQDAIPPTYTDTYLVESTSRMCCKYAAAPSGTSRYDPIVGSVMCGMALLDLPRVGEFHCSMVGRAATICCNGRIAGSQNSSSVPVIGDTYTYLGNTCLYVPQSGDAAVHGGVWAVVSLAATALPVLVALL